jgi:phytol kinase
MGDNMNQNILGLLISYLFVFSVIGLASLLSKFTWFDDEASRKFIHIGVGHWWLIALIFFDHPIWASIAPLSFVFLNYMSYKKSLFKAMERSNPEGGLGTVYYALSLLILTYISFSLNLLYVGGVGILVMTYSDGLAALVGKNYGKHLLMNNKSLEGSLTVFVSAFFVVFILLNYYQMSHVFLIALSLALCATLIELFSPHGFDNLTLPLGMSVLTALIYMVV